MLRVMLRVPLRLLVLLVAVPLLAQRPISVTPSVGSTAGGDEIIIKGDFQATPAVSVLFDIIPAPFAERLDPFTIRAITPPHLPGTVRVSVPDKYFTYWAGHEFTYVGEIPASFERVLLPVFGPPVFGVNGSEFRTELRLANPSTEKHLPVLGVRKPCGACEYFKGMNILTGEEVSPDEIEYDDPPGFLFVPKERSRNLVAQLRAFDISRAATNFGTQIPIVLERDMFVDEEVVLLGVPTDARFRNTLRIYGTRPATVTLAIQTEGAEGASGMIQQREITLPPVESIFSPTYIQISDLPVNAGTIKLRILPGVPPISGSAVAPSLWAFVTVTNNETQHITVISPQR